MSNEGYNIAMKEKSSENNNELNLENIKALFAENNKILVDMMDTKIVANNITLEKMMEDKIVGNNVVLGEIMDRKIVGNNGLLEGMVDEKIEGLAIMMQAGFADVIIRTVSKDEFNSFRYDMNSFRDKTEKSLFNLETDMVEVKKTVSKIENIVEPVQVELGSQRIAWRDHESRISKLEEKAA